MSESLNWPAIGLWTAFTSFQIGTAIRDICNEWRQRRISGPSTDYVRVIGGERINGWKIAIPLASFDGVERYFCSLVKCRWATNKGDLANFSRYSQLLWFTRFFSVNNRMVFHLNRFSFLTPNANAFIMRVTYENWWEWTTEIVHYMTDRLVVVVLRINVDPAFPIFHLTVLDVVTGSHRIVVIKSPIEDCVLVMVFLSDHQGRINVLFGGKSWRNQEMEPEMEVLDYEITIASYNIADFGTIEAPIKATTWQSIAIPMGDKRILWKSVSSDLLMLHIYQEATDIESIRSFSFCEGTWHVDSLSTWLSFFRATSYGAKWMNAVEAFGALSPPSSIQGEIPPLQYARRISGFTIDGAVLCRPDGAGILERSLSPHSLKRLAAEAFCKANPKFDFADLKSVIGFDVFGYLRRKRTADDPFVKQDSTYDSLR